MIGIALILTAFAIADLIAGGLAGQPLNPDRPRWALKSRSWLGLFAGTLVILVGGFCYDFQWSLNVITAGSTAVAIGAWLIFKTDTASKTGQPNDTDALMSIFALVWVSVVLITTLLMTPVWPSSLKAEIANWTGKLPLNLPDGWEPVHIFVYIGVMLFLSAPANSIVRMSLTVAGTDWRKSQQKLRGGRLIGILERWLIFGLATAGEPTAAALIVSAKSLLRFPELSRTSAKSTPTPGEPLEVDLVTEYFLLGSLLSWTLALFPAFLFP